MNYENFEIIKSGSTFCQYVHKGKESAIIVFDSAAALVEYNEIEKWGEYSTNISWTYGNDGYGTSASTYNALKTGSILEKHIQLIDKYKEELYNRKPELKNLEHIAQTKKRRRKFNEDDGELCIDRYMSGDPAMFVKTTPTPIRGSIVRMHFDLPTRCDNEFKNFIEGMAWCIAMLDIIQSSGKSVELTIGYTATNAIYGVPHTSMVFTAKRADEPLDTIKLMTYGLSGLFRNYVFNAWQNLHIGKGGNPGGPISSFNECPSVAEFLDVDILFKSTGIMHNGKIEELIAGVSRLFKSDF